MKQYFPNIEKIKYEGHESKNPMAFRYYDAERVVNGKKMKDWIATARNFMRGDMEKNKLHRLQAAGPGGLSPDAVEYLQSMGEGLEWKQ